MGHARALLSLTSPTAIAELAAEIVAAGMSVRETERRVRTRSASPPLHAPAKKKASRSDSGSTAPEQALRHMQDTLRRQLQTDVHIEMNAQQKGCIRISFYSADDLTRVLEILSGAPQVGD
jgi:ParB family transcriptional regulator, chromosome partitioning protein